MKLSGLSLKAHRMPVAIVAVTLIVAALAWPLLATLPADTATGRSELPISVLTLGVILGLTYGLLGAGLVIVYRTSRIINFAHGEIGAFSAALFGLAVVQWHVPYWLAFPLALAIGAAVASLTEVAVIRRLRNAPRLMSIIATLGVGQFLLLFSFALKPQAVGEVYPQPPGIPDFMIGTFRVGPAFSGMLLLTPLLILGLGLFLKRTRFGIGIRSASANPDAARMAGISASRMASLAWALAGIMAAFTAISIAPTRGFQTVESFGPALLLMALAAAALARMTSIPVAVLSGIALGVMEQFLNWNYRVSGSVEVVTFLVILLALLMQKKRGGREEEKGSWATVQAVRPLPGELKSIWLLRNFRKIAISAALGIGIVLPLLISNATAVSMTIIFAFAIVGVSIGVVTGMGGQLTLGQFGFAGIGAVVSYHVSARTGWFPLSFLYAGVVAAFIALLVGLPALRIRGMMVTVTTLAFALALPAAVLGNEWFFGDDGVNPGRPVVLGYALVAGKDYYLVGLLTLVFVLILTRNVRNSGFGRLLISIRDNEDSARAFSVPATWVKMQAFMFAGFVAGVGGAMYGHAFASLGTTAFPVAASIDVAKIAVIGGISMLSGPLIGALFIKGLPLFVPLGAAGLAASSLGQLLIIMYLPQGLVQVVISLRDGIARFLGKRAGIDVRAAFARRDGHAAEDHTSGQVRDFVVRRRAPTLMGSRNGSSSSEKLLEAHSLRKHFGGVRAVDGVSFDVFRGETLGLIGPNGAGKTTLFELLGGFSRPDNGTILFKGRDVTWLPPEVRARHGLIRSFQDAALFPTMTVEEAIMLAGERDRPTRFFSSASGIRYGETRKRRHAAALVELMGLDRYRTKQIMELSTGTRRIAELACMVALKPAVLLLDEPSSGIAQRETEALGLLLSDLKRQFGMTLIVIEHDIPMIMSISDRIIAMADGRVLAAGSPSEVRNDPRVISAYLGDSVTAIERSCAGPDKSSRVRGHAVSADRL